MKAEMPGWRRLPLPLPTPTPTCFCFFLPGHVFQADLTLALSSP